MQLRDSIKEWQEDGVNVVVIGNGNANFAQAFREDFHLSGPVLVDPELAAYRAAGLRRGRREIASPKMFTNALRAYGTGARQTGVQGDPWQLGGLFAFAAGGDLLFEHRSAAAGDHAAPEAVSAALLADVEPLDESGEGVSRVGAAVDQLRPLLDASPLLSFDRVGFRRHALGFDSSDMDVDLFGRRCLVTGANSGIGFATAQGLADLGAEVVLLCRSEERGKEAAAQIRTTTGNPRVSVVKLDMSDLKAVKRVGRRLAKEPVDVLVHNAGCLPDRREETAEELELTFAVHVAGPHCLTRLLRPALEKSEDARVVFVSSGGMLTRRLQVKDPQWIKREYDGVLAYAETKRAQVVLAALWAEHFAAEGVDISVTSMHPGWADTQSVEDSLPLFHRVTKPILRTAEEGADTVLWLAASERKEDRSGRFFFDRKPVRAHWVPKTVETAEERETLWQICESF